MTEEEYTVSFYQTTGYLWDNGEKIPQEFWNYSVHTGDGTKPGSLKRYSGRPTFEEAVEEVKNIIKNPPTPCLCAWDGKTFTEDKECLVHGENPLWKQKLNA